MTASPNRSYLPEVDQLRGIAALLVFFYHGFQLFGARLAHGAVFDPSKHWVISRNPIIATIEEGHSGVGLFIVLSGFILSIGTVGRPMSYGKFLLARILRIYPLLLVFAIVAFAVAPTDLSNMIATIQPFGASNAQRGNLVAMFWAVAVEFQCYLIFPFLILFSDRFGTRFLVQIIASAIALRCLAVFSEGAIARDISYWTVVGRIDQFCLGMIAARLYLLHGWRERVGRLVFLPVAIAVLLILWVFNRAGGWPLASHWKLLWPTVEGGFWAVFVLCYLRIGPSLPALLSRPLTQLGVVSYSLYLVHFTVINLCIANGLYLRMTGTGYYDALLTTAFVAVPIALGISLLLYDTIEKPFMQLRPRYVEVANGA
ncbi:MAG TPA: acyltransferase [Aliidongia sp.]|uniref:acyltransferase family protein n=1 Tax=Aliidongia sp. TaxID=1914230 RepID=UPI002DDD4BD3|nr:acyltransferase [Aliidongia sp.]HEV2676081.1 acyltransferase [Aliidongia sp.]